PSWTFWRCMGLHGIPVNPKYKEGFRSLGCAVCSVEEKNGELPERHGRWKGTAREGGECGIHTQQLKD
ncbi:MAG: phosphoadenylyl-sulfate reductase, partial [bacterium]